MTKLWSWNLEKSLESHHSAEALNNLLSNEIFLFLSDVQQAVALILVVEHEQAVEKLMLIEVLNEAGGEVNVVFFALRGLLSLLNLGFLVVHDLAQFKAETILALVTLLFADVLVLVVC